nr:restriction endonuclease subunit S [Brevibacterium sp. XM4083]
MCPRGVEFKELGDCVTRNVGGGTPSRSKLEYWNGGVYWASVGDITATMLKIRGTRQTITGEGLQASSSNLVAAGWVVVAVKIAPGAMRVVEQPIAINQDIRGLLLNVELDPYFLTYYFKTLHIVGNGTIVKGITNQTLMRIRVPVPPLEVQREIVRVLDKFTQLEAELEVELEAELEARRDQYEHYRDELVRGHGYRRKRLADLGTFVRGRRFTKSDVVEAGIPSLHYGEIYTVYGTSATRAVRHIRADLRDELRFAQPGSVVFAGVGETVADVGKAVAWLGEEPIATHDDTFVFSSDLDPKYVAYAVQTADFHRQKERHVSRAKVKRLSATGLGAIEIPVPSLEEQASIVRSLDRFDALVNDISIGLPAELDARRKQYEYYRDRLLTFKGAV